MNYSRLVAVSLFATILLSSCAKRLTYFTQNLYEDNNWSQSELKRIQFYLSKDIELYRTMSGGSSTIQDGKIKLEDKRKVDQILIKKGTPGTFVFSPKENRYAVSFDNSGAYLMFGPGKKTNGRYVLRAKEWRSRGQGGIITYGEEEYYTGTENAYAALMVDLKKARKTSVNTKTASGSKVN